MLLGCCCWAALYALSGTYYDLARVDALWAFFLTGALSSLVMYSRQLKSIWLFVCVFCLWLAVMTKQTVLVLLPFYWLALWCLSNLRLAVCSGLALVALLGVSVLFLQWHSDGFFYFYTMQMGRSHGFNSGLPFNFLLGDMLNGVPVYLLLSGIFIALFGKNLRNTLAWILIFFGYFLMGLLSRWYTGGWINALIPLHQLMVIMAVSGFYLVLKKLYGQKGRLWKYGLMAMISVLFTLNIARGYIRADYMLPSVA
ncbi:MAG: hypothetical protein IT470_00020, partial [Pseudomonadales bacterium]|nr:hypothetical protein [Pseudomonadales bacterium]